MMKKYWMAVSKDKYRLPIAVADSAGQLARMLGKARGTIDSSVSHGKKAYERIEVDEDEYDEFIRGPAFKKASEVCRGIRAGLLIIL